jgi:hypothetical protein
VVSLFSKHRQGMPVRDVAAVWLQDRGIHTPLQRLAVHPLHQSFFFVFV